MKLIIDLDDTLVSSSQLNNDAYNYALEKFGFIRIETKNRITRKDLQFIDSSILNKIINEKQNYFTMKWLPYRLTINKVLLNKVKDCEWRDCFIWTKADETRTNAILKYCDLYKYFKTVIFDNKTDFNSSIENIKKATNSNSFIIYENNAKFFYNQKVKVVDKIKSNSFNIKGYLIN